MPRRDLRVLAIALLGLTACDDGDIPRMLGKSQGTLAVAIGMPMKEVMRRSTLKLHKMPSFGLPEVDYSTGSAYFDFELVGSALRFHGCSMYSVRASGPDETVTAVNVYITPKRHRWGAFRRELTETAAKLRADQWAPHSRRGETTLESFLQDGSKLDSTSSGAIARFDWSKGAQLLRVTAHRAWDSAQYWSSFDLTEEAWLKPAASWDSFPAYPGARKLCSQHVTGSSGGQRREIDWSLYATKDRADVVSFYSAYAHWHGLKSDLVDKRLVLVSPEGAARLTVHEASDTYPDCGVRPAADEKGVVLVSRRSP
jgi:hypothetical protein